MLAEKADTLIRIAEEKLNMAVDETNRANEDVVTHLICVNSRDALSKYMQAFLLINDIAPDEPVTLSRLLEQCKAIDARFDTVDLSNIHCRFETHDRDYCLDRGQVDSCMEVARRTREIVMNRVPGF